ncbi:hypothetical protein HK097_009437 [Rhizophlyctis rosea]|uniref:Uncharacterized protein n=1 Tax=Rhizophlyctis rosea TaxID=64517 RepID=A0AAD5X138_9FUNG|nr:hypothetical protein HK097_009437 [Rhizophlyctis rosea]
MSAAKDMTMLLPNEVWAEILSLLKSPEILFKTTHAFRKFGKDPHTRSHYLRSRFGTKAALVNALATFPNLLTVDQTLYPKYPPDKVITLLLDAGAAFPRSVVQKVFKTPPSPSKRFSVDLVATLVKLGYEKYGSDLDIYGDDDGTFASAIDDLLLHHRTFGSHPDKSRHIKIVQDLIKIHGYIPTFKSQQCKDLATTKSEDLFSIFLSLQNSGFPCRKYIAEINNSVVTSRLLLHDQYPVASFLTDAQYLFDRGFKVTKWACNRMMTALPERFLDNLPMFRHVYNHSELLPLARKAFSTHIKYDCRDRPRLSHSQNYVNQYQKEFPEITDTEIDEMFVTAYQTLRDSTVMVHGRMMDPTAWEFLLTRFGCNHPLIQRLFSLAMETPEMSLEALRLCLEAGCTLEPRHVKWLVDRIKYRDHFPIVEAFVGSVAGRHKEMHVGERKEWVRVFEEGLEAIERGGPDDVDFGCLGEGSALGNVRALKLMKKCRDTLIKMNGK